MILFRRQRKAVSVQAGPIPALRFGCMPILARCRQYGNHIHAVTGLRINLRRLRGRNILRRIRIFTASLVQYGNEEKAIQIAERCYKKCLDDGKNKPSEMCPACMVQRLVEEICKKICNC